MCDASAAVEDSQQRANHRRWASYSLRARLAKL